MCLLLINPPQKDLAKSNFHKFAKSIRHELIDNGTHMVDYHKKTIELSHSHPSTTITFEENKKIPEK